MKRIKSLRRLEHYVCQTAYFLRHHSRDQILKTSYMKLCKLLLTEYLDSITCS